MNVEKMCVHACTHIVHYWLTDSMENVYFAFVGGVGHNRGEQKVAYNIKFISCYFFYDYDCMKV